MKVALALLGLAGTGCGFLQAPGSRLELVSRRSSAVQDAPSTAAAGVADLAAGSELYIANLAYDTSHAELRAVMEFFGDITEVKIPRDKTTGQGRGFGFVSFSTSTEAETARMVTNGLSFKDRKLGVSISKKSSGKQANPSVGETLEVLKGNEDASAGDVAGSGRAYDKAAVLLNQQITMCDSVESVLLISSNSGFHFNNVNLATSINRLGRLTGPQGRVDSSDARVQKLLNLAAERIAAEPGGWDARELTNTAHGVARMRYYPAGDLLAPIASAACARIGSFSPQQLANLAFAYGSARVAAPALFDAVASAAAARVGEFSPFQLANLAWAFAKANVAAPALYAAIARAAPASVDKLSPQQLANLAWAFGKNAKGAAPELFGAIARSAPPRIDEFSPQHISNLAWGFAKAQVDAPELFATLAGAAKPRIGEFKPAGLDTLRWAFSKGGQKDTSLLDAIAQARTQGTKRFLKRYQELTAAERDDARHNFDRIDKDGSGYLDVNEIRLALLEMNDIAVPSLRDCQARLRLFDSDGNGELDFDEFCLMMASARGTSRRGKLSWVKSLLTSESSAPIAPRKPQTYRLTKNEREDARVNFGKIDVDGSGTLDASEIHQALITMNYIVSLQDCKVRLQEFDVDGNGELDFDEFCLMMASTKGGAKSEGKVSWAKSLLLGDSSSRSAKSAIERDAVSRPARARSVPSVKSVPSKPSA